MAGTADATHKGQIIQVFGSVSNELQTLTLSNATGGTFTLSKTWMI